MLRPRTSDVPTVEGDGARGRFLQACYDAKQRRLARTVRADEGQCLAPVHAHRDPEQHLEVPVAEVDVTDVEHTLAGGVHFTVHRDRGPGHHEKLGWKLGSMTCQHLHASLNCATRQNWPPVVARVPVKSFGPAG